MNGSKLFFFLIVALLLVSFNIDGHKQKYGDLAKGNFSEFRYVYHFYKHELEESHVEPAAYKPKVFNISGQVMAQLYERDTLIKFVHKSLSGKFKGDSTIELFRILHLEAKEQAMIPSTLFGCRFLGIYNSSREDNPENFYNCFYTNDNGDLLKVFHLYKLGNVHAAFFFTKDSIDPTIKYKNDIAKLLAADRPFNNTDSVNVEFEIHLK